MKTPRVILVVDRGFGARLSDLPHDVPVWIVDTAQNRPAIKAGWARGDSITSFCDYPESSAAQLVLGILNTIETHHGSDSQVPAFERLTIAGAGAVEEFESNLAELGFTAVSREPGALEYVRTAPAPPP